MTPFDFKGWLKKFAMNREKASQVFGVCQRSITRWRQTAQIPGSALTIIRTIDLQAAPWNHSYTRSAGVGITCTAFEWREWLYGSPWQNHRTPEEKRLQKRMQARADAHRAAQAEIRRQRNIRRAESRKALRVARQSLAPLQHRNVGPHITDLVGNLVQPVNDVRAHAQHQATQQRDGPMLKRHALPFSLSRIPAKPLRLASTMLYGGGMGSCDRSAAIAAQVEGSRRRGMMFKM